MEIGTQASGREVAIPLFCAGMAVVLKRSALQNAVFVMGTLALVAGSVFFAVGESM